MRLSRQFWRCFCVFALIFAGLVSAQSTSLQNITPQQIEQFKKLPTQQQRALAQQMGISFSQIQQLLATEQTNLNDNQNAITSSIYPRGTQFDEFGNPQQSPSLVERFLTTETDELQPFGYDLFAGAPSTFAPTFDVPVPANYILGPGDTIHLQLYGKESMSYQLQVDRQGLLLIPSLEPIKLAGLTFAEAKSFVANQMKQNMLGIESHMSMGELRSMRIFVLGEAYKPGAYTVSSLTSITQALFVSGGVNDIASLRNVQLKRAGKVIEYFDLYDLLIYGDTSNDVLLQPGDVVFIPTIENTVSVAGKVRRPGIYELKGEVTINDAVALAGGFESAAYAGLVNVQRVENGVTTQLSLTGNDIHEVAKNGDFIDVLGVSDSVSEAITLVGAVARPGKFQWTSDTTLSSLISSQETDLLSETDLNYGLILRNYRTGKNLSIKQFSPLALIEGNPAADLKLEKDDFIVLFSNDENVEIGNESLENLAKTKDALAKQEKEAWKSRIEQRLFWQELGFEVEDPELTRREQEEAAVKEPIIRLTELEKQNLSRFRDSSAFSRKRLLTPIIERLKNHASFAQPLKVVEISGSVQFPGLYPLPDNGKISDIFWAAGGLAESAFAFQSELTRYELSQGGQMQVRNINFKPVEVTAGDNDILLASRDRINVYKNPEWQEELQVELKGEVAFPGWYTIRKGETLNSVVRRAGGLTEFAEPNASIFLRESLKKQESSNLSKLTEDLRKEIASEGLRSKSGSGSLVSYSEVQKLLRDLTDVEAVGRLVIDLPSILAGDSSQDFPLESGDVLAVPARNKTVNVIGEVYVPTSHLFDSAIDFETYVDLSGGYKNFAAKERTYIIKSNGAVVVPNRDEGYWFQSEQDIILIDAGDTIVVPYDSGHIDNLTLWTSASQIAYQMAVTIAALGSL